MAQELVLKNKSGSYAEVLTDYILDSYKYTYEINNERSIEFTAYKTNTNSDIFDMLTNENRIIADGQEYVIKSSTLKFDSQVTTNEVVAKHIYMSFQDFYIDKDIMSEELNTDTEESEESEEELAPNYTLQQYLDFAFKGNPIFTYEIVGDTNRRAPIAELGNKNGMEYIVEGAELFGYIYFADNTKIYFYQPSTFYQAAQTPIIYGGNSDSLDMTISTTEMFTYAKGYGKKKTTSETKAYDPIKPAKLKYTGTFVKSGVWYTTGIGNSYSKTFNCKWGNEDLLWTKKKGSGGGIVDLYLDGDKIATYNTWRKTASTEVIVVKRNMEQGEHTLKAVFRGGQSGVNYKGKTPRMYVGTEKTTVINLTAVLKGTDTYYANAEYKSPNYEAFGHMQMPTVFDDNATTKAQVEEVIKDTMNDEPTVEIATSYLGSYDDQHFIMNDDLTERSLVRFIHRPLGFNTDLRIAKITKFHSKLQKPCEVEFSNAKADIISIQNQMNLRLKRATSSIANGNWQTGINKTQPFFSDVMGSVIVDD